MGLALLIGFALIFVSGLTFYSISLRLFNAKYSGKFSFLPRLNSVQSNVQNAFGLTFAACCCLFELIIFEIFGLFQDSY